jgi:hypothetical protein
MKFRQFSLFLLILLSACGSIEPAYVFWLPWQLADLRLLKLPDTIDPTSDLIAVYSRLNGGMFQVRLDLLDMQPDQKFDVIILLDSTLLRSPNRFPAAPSVVTSALATQRWDWLLVFPYGGKPRAFQSGSLQPDINMSPGIQLDSLLDTVTININPKSIPDISRLVMQVFITTPGGRILLDQSPPVSSERSPGMSGAPLLLVFSDTFPAVTPAQALRRWDGAHSGPIGSRHGLEHILSNADIYNVPVTLLDLKTPTSLSALDFINGMPLIEDLVNRDLLILPDVAYAQPDSFSLLSSRNTALAFNLPGSLFVFASDTKIQTGYNFQFTSLPDPTHLLHQSGRVLIPLPDLSHGNTPIQATVDGLDLEIRRQLLSTALSSDPTDLVVLGGSLPHSTWGNADISTASIGYIASHPWIQPLNADQLQTLGSHAATQIIDPQPPSTQPFQIYSSDGQPIGLDSDQLVSQLLQDLENSPHNFITDSAWQMFYRLSSPDENILSSQLNFQYLNQVESLLAASRWMDNPTHLSDCSQDIDLDTKKECVLANQQFFAIFETDGGRLSFLFTRVDGLVHQLVGPQSQLTVGLSDTSLWDPLMGPAGDPAEIPGAFSDKNAPFSPYTITTLEVGSLTMTRSDGQVQKTFTFLDNGLNMECLATRAVTLRIPLVLDPQARFQTGWQLGYNSLSTKDIYRWGFKDGLTIEIHGSNLYSRDFIESRSLLSNPENPNLDYPVGHYLPFPLALVETNGNGQFSIQILVMH